MQELNIATKNYLLQIMVSARCALTDKYKTIPRALLQEVPIVDPMFTPDMIHRKLMSVDDLNTTVETASAVQTTGAKGDKVSARHAEVVSHLVSNAMQGHKDLQVAKSYFTKAQKNYKSKPSRKTYRDAVNQAQVMADSRDTFGIHVHRYFMQRKELVKRGFRTAEFDEPLVGLGVVDPVDTNKIVDSVREKVATAPSLTKKQLKSPSMRG